MMSVRMLIVLLLQWRHSLCLLLMVMAIVCSGGAAASTSSSALFIPHSPRLQNRWPRGLVSNFMSPNPHILTSPSSSSSRVIANCPELGGDIIRIRAGPEDELNDAAGFLTAMGVPTFAVDASTHSSDSSHHQLDAILSDDSGSCHKPRRMSLEGILRNPNAFVLENALSATACEHILNTCEYELQFGSYNAGKNNHGAMQIVISKDVADALLRVIGPHIDLEGVISADKELRGEGNDDVDMHDGTSYALTGINRRFRIYRYAPDRNEKFAPHIDAGFPPGGVSLDDIDHHHDGSMPYLHWDASHQYPSTSEVVSRLTVLIYLNDDFSGGHTKFYEPMSERSGINDEVIASIKPRAGSILVFPQAVSEPSVDRARQVWPLHEGSPVTSGKRPKYVIRTDVLFETIKNDDRVSEEDKILFQHDDAVRNVFLNVSPMFSTLFLHHVHPLYNPHMGVENAGPLLYSLVRFTKCRRIVEVGAGYTTLYLLQALKDNEEEMQRVVDLDLDGRLRLLDYPFGTPRLTEWLPTSSNDFGSSLLCIDNCEHQRETASSAVNVARTLGLDHLLHFLKGDAFDALETHFSEDESIDMLWCDFGVGARMSDYVSKVWRFVRPGGFLACHSTLTNARTREWLEAVRQRRGEAETGLPTDEYTELSLLEPHKRFQNSISILQKRQRFEEPIYSEYA